MHGQPRSWYGAAPVADVNTNPDMPPTSSAEITALIAAAEGGDDEATTALFAALYAELHRMARRELAVRHGAVTLSATTLLHEAYLALANREREFPDRPRFMAYASRVMRGVIIDHARRRQAIKRGGGFELTTLDTAVAPVGKCNRCRNRRASSTLCTALRLVLITSPSPCRREASRSASSSAVNCRQPALHGPTATPAPPSRRHASPVKRSSGA